MSVVVSVNVGEPRIVEWAGRNVETAIWKTPVAGRVALAGINLRGDRQADRRVHGGSDKAVYAYAAADYRWWEEQLAARLEPGTFGENLTVDGVDLAGAGVGEIWRIGSATLQVAQPRLPCFKLGIRMGDAGFVDRFGDAGRLGVYFRVIEEGDIGAGDRIERATPPEHGLTAYAIAEAHETLAPALVRQLLTVPEVPDTWRVWAERALGRMREG